MAIRLQFRCEIKDGKLRPLDAMQWALHLSRCKPGLYDVTVERHRERRSDNQNRWYWGVIVPILAEHCGYEPEEMHDALRWKFLSKQIEGRPPTVRGSSELNTAEFAYYCDRIVRWAASEYGIAIPPPDGAVIGV